MVELHKKDLGSLGELKVAAAIIELGHSVFTELGDNAKVDLIALVDDEPVKIQVKTRRTKDGLISVDSRKSGPNYKFRYTEGQVDVFAVYAVDEDLIFYVTAKELLKNKSSSAFRVVAAKTRNKFTRYAADYMDFKKALRGRTQSTLTGDAEGKETVQTTTT